MVFCTYCGQSFTRDEHLERHILTHTNVKPFRCFNCHMTFARRDLLQRHYTVHGKEGSMDPNSVNGMIPKSAGRTPIACNNCAKTKTKCDKKFPCSRCASRNLKCTARPTRRTSKNAPAAAADTVTVAPSEVDVREESSIDLQVPATEVTPPPEAQPIFLDQMTMRPEELTPPRSSGQNSPQNVTPLDGQPLSSPTALPGAYLEQHSLSYDDFKLHGHSHSSSESSINSASPTMMFDWTQVQLGSNYEPMARADMLVSPTALSFHSTGSMQNHGDIMNYLPDFNQSMSLQTPLPTPTFDGGFSSLDIDQSGAVQYASHFQQSETPPNTERDPITAAQEGWTVFRCTPPLAPHLCPKTARLNLERLQESLRSPDIWSNWQPTWEDTEMAHDDQIAIVPLQEMARDKLMAITQSFLHKALDIHKYEQTSLSSGENSPTGHRSNFVLLPPSRVLDHFFRSYTNNFESFFPLTPKGTLNTDELMHGYNDKASSLLLLLMIAQGAMTIPGEARWLTSGLTEACRISLFDLIEKNIIMASDSIVLRSALIFTVQAAWSGDKWLMDIAAGQRGMYFAMLRHSGFLEDRQNSVPSNEMCANVDVLWNDWVGKESRSRLIYSWVMVDQDLSLLHDTAPLFSVTEFGAPMPDSNVLWNAKTGAQWSSLFEQVHEFSSGFSSVGSGARPLSLRDLFRHFLDDTVVNKGVELTPLHLRLLLHPLQSLVCQCRQLLSCFSNSGLPTPGEPGSPLTAASTQSRLTEVQSMLQRWWSLYQRYLTKSGSHTNDPMMQATLVVFHLISLNTVTNFPEIESLARKEGVDGTYQQLRWLHKRCIFDIERAVYHCGQILMLVRTMPHGVTPPWWPGAIYRVALILWADSLVHKDTLTANSGFYPNGSDRFAVDAVAPDHPVVMRYLTNREGIPTLTKRDGTPVEMDNSFAVLSHCVDIVEQTAKTQFAEGIRNKLMRVASQKI